jgi:hypothetical protein
MRWERPLRTQREGSKGEVTRKAPVLKRGRKWQKKSANQGPIITEAVNLNSLVGFYRSCCDLFAVERIGYTILPKCLG